MFIDKVVVNFSAGRGGNGVVAWTRLKYIPKGGPCGGNGGKGGSIVLETCAEISSLDWFRNRRIIKAENGRQGGPNLQKGRNGKDLILKIPCGTLVKNLDTQEVIADMTKDKEKLILCEGGKGGRGNDSFKSPTNRAPNQYTEGKEGEEISIELELKLIADVGLVGFPNAGKSTLISKLTHVRPKIAAYPFTTLRPHLGYITLKDLRRITLADIPGIIEGAHRNRGLGFEFLRHIERTRLLIFMLDASGIDGRDPVSDWRVLKDEMGKYNKELLKRPYIVVLNKSDTDEAKENSKIFKRKVRIPKGHLFEISALTGDGLDSLLDKIIALAS